MTAINTLKKWFSNFKKPNQEQFWAWIDSFWHKSEQIPMSSIDGLDRIIEGTASAQQLQNHLTDTNAHKGLFDGKVDKVEGKGLSSNDFTNAYKQQLDTLEDYDIELDESTTELKFKKGSNVIKRISLMFLDDEGTKLVYNKVNKNLELRDKRNNLLTSIPISHFVSNIPTSIVVQNGKIKLMAGSEVIDENTISYNDLADKPELNYLPLSGGTVTGDVSLNGNLLINDKVLILVRDNGKIAFGNKPFNDLIIGEFKGIQLWGQDNDKVVLAGGGVLNSAQLLGRVVGSEVSSNWTAGTSWQNNTIFIESAVTIELNQLQHLSSISFRKVFDTGTITFTCTGKTIKYTTDNIFNGKDGSTAVVSIYNNTCYIDIRNI